MKLSHQITTVAALVTLAGCSSSDQSSSEKQSGNPAPAQEAREQPKDTALATAPPKDITPAPPLAANPSPPPDLSAPAPAAPAPTPPATVAPPVVPAAEAKPAAPLANALSETKDEFMTSMDKKLADLDAKMAELAQKSEGYKDAAKVEADKALVTLREQRDKAKQKCDEARTTTADSWKDLKAGVELAINELEAAYENAKSKFN